MVAGWPLCALHSEELACNNKMTCAAVITDKYTSDRAAFTTSAATMHR